jgi:hypothetical protein
MRCGLGYGGSAMRLECDDADEKLLWLLGLP